MNIMHIEVSAAAQQLLCTTQLGRIFVTILPLSEMQFLLVSRQMYVCWGSFYYEGKVFRGEKYLKDWLVETMASFFSSPLYI